MQSSVIRFMDVIVLWTLVSGGTGTAADKPTGNEGPMAKVDHVLATLYEKQEAYLAQGGGAVFTPSNPLLRVAEGRVVVDAVASGDVQALKRDLEALGM